MSSIKIQILLVSQDKYIREDIETLCKYELDYELVGIYDHVKDIHDAMQSLSPDVILIDTQLSDYVIKLASDLEQSYSIPIILFITPQDPLARQKVLVAGIRHVLSSPLSLEELNSMIRLAWNESSTIEQVKYHENTLTESSGQKPITETIETHFSLYSASEFVANTRSYLYVYAHSTDHIQSVEEDILKFTEKDTGVVPKARRAKQTSNIAVGTEILVVPECEDITFEPVSLSKIWHGDWSRFIFEFRPSSALIDDMLFIRVSIRVEGIEIAHIKTSCSVIEMPMNTVDTSTKLSDNPLINAKQRGDLSVISTKPYTKMFISYSRRDQQIALQRAQAVEKILGTRVFLDVKSLRAGDDWQYQLAKAIDDADIFHLLWSEHSAKSEYCRYEWQYALQKKCPENLCIGVIRPLYWQKPIPTPPDELSHLHFEHINWDDVDPELPTISEE